MAYSFFSSKLPNVGTTIFTVMSALAHKHQAINLSQGFPDFDCDPELTRKVTRAMNRGFNQYAPMPGLPALREEIAILVKILYGADFSAGEEITITSGASEALFCAITAVVGEGDEVIVVEPSYDLYIPAIELCGGIPVCYPTRPPSYKIDWDRLKKLVNTRTRAIILNTPQNPTGTVFTKEDIGQLVRLLKDSQIMVISDEVYEHIIFDGQKHLSIAGVPELRDRSFIISSFGKSLHTTGWKVGFCIAPPVFTREFRKVHQFVAFSTSTPFQYAIAEYLQEKRNKILDLKHFYQEKRDLFLQLMAPTPFVPIHSAGTYFQLMDYSAISDEPDTVFAQRLIAEYGVASIPVSVFYRKNDDHRVIRFCFAKEEKTLQEAAKRLERVGG